MGSDFSGRTRKLRVFLAEDHSMVRAGIKLLVNSQPDMQVVGEAGNGDETLQQITELQPDLAILDISMPGMNGVAVTHHLQLAHPQVKVLALSVHNDKSYLREMLEAGASGYVLKQAAAEDLINAIHVAAGGGVYIDIALASLAVQVPAPRSSRRRKRQENTLSLREAEIVRLISQGYSNKEIAGQLNLSIKTVETYKARAMEKLSVKSRAELVRYALERGWLKS